MKVGKSHALNGGEADADLWELIEELLLLQGPNMRSKLATDTPNEQYSILLINFNAANPFIVQILINHLMRHNYGLTAVPYQNRAVLKHDAVLHKLGITFDWNGFVVAGKRLYAISFGVIKGIVDIDVIILTNRVELLPIGAEETLRIVAVFLVNDELHVETVAIDYFDRFAC